MVCRQGCMRGASRNVRGRCECVPKSCWKPEKPQFFIPHRTTLECVLDLDFCCFNQAAVFECFPVSQKAFLDALVSMDLPGTSSVLAVTLHLLLRLPPGTRLRLSRKANVVFRPLLDHMARLLVARDPYPTAAILGTDPPDAATAASLPPEDACSAQSKGRWTRTTSSGCHCGIVEGEYGVERGEPCACFP